MEQDGRQLSAGAGVILFCWVAKLFYTIYTNHIRCTRYLFSLLFVIFSSGCSSKSLFISSIEMLLFRCVFCFRSVCLMLWKKA